MTRCRGIYGPSARYGGYNEKYFLPPTSEHSGGVTMLLLDGSVTFMGDSVNEASFRAYGTRAGGNPPSMNVTTQDHGNRAKLRRRSQSAPPEDRRLDGRKRSRRGKASRSQEGRSDPTLTQRTDVRRPASADDAPIDEAAFIDDVAKIDR
jgi:prepilin-type processing-associated H-X9-DG protein